MAATDSTIIQQIIAPATMIPACGLLLLSSTARMNTVLARIRTFHHERLEVWKLDVQPGTRADSVRRLRLEGLEHQTHRLIRRARLLRLTMLPLIAAVTCNLISVLGLAAGFVADDITATLQTGAVAVFILGIAMIVAAMVTSYIEVFRITETVQYEHHRVETLCQHEPPAEFESARSHMGEGTGL